MEVASGPEAPAVKKPDFVDDLLVRLGTNVAQIGQGADPDAFFSLYVAIRAAGDLKAIVELGIPPRRLLP